MLSETGWEVAELGLKPRSHGSKLSSVCIARWFFFVRKFYPMIFMLAVVTTLVPFLNNVSNITDVHYKILQIIIM